MNLELGYSVQHILILGAGASTDYGLPVWKDLSSLIKHKIDSDKADTFQNKKEISAWIDKIGENKEHATLDQCISTESVSGRYPNGDEIEDQIFRIIKEIFNDKYKNDAIGWIRKLNDGILGNGKRLEGQIAFINYNYDRALDDLLLNYSYLHQKLRRNNYRERLNELRTAEVSVLYPHGNLYEDTELKSPTYTRRYIDTMKSHDDSQVNAVSCYESRQHSVSKENLVSKFNLYILGLGGGLEVNLNNLNFRNPISAIHITARDESFRGKASSFLSNKYRIPVEKIQTYTSCEELIEKCFSVI